MMKAMACGAIPITSRFESSVLQDLTRVPSTSSTASSKPIHQTISTTPTVTTTAINDFPPRDYNDFPQRDYNDFDMGPRRALTDSIAQDPAQYQQWVSHTKIVQYSRIQCSVCSMPIPCLPYP